MKERVIYKERKNTNCEKWDGLLDEYGRKDLLPVWVADMDFEAPSCVQVALQKYIDFNVYGYYHLSDSFYDSIISWEKKLSRVSSKKRMDSFYSWCSSGNLLVDTNVDSERGVCFDNATGLLSIF